MTRQEELDQKLTDACETLDFQGVCKAVADGANVNVSCDKKKVWWFYSCLSLVLDSAFHSKDDSAFGIAYEIVKYFLEHGANPNKICRMDKGESLLTPLYDAFYLCPDTKIPRLLLEHGAEVNLPHEAWQGSLFDLIYDNWRDALLEWRERPEEATEEVIRRKGLRYFHMRELLLEHSAQKYHMLHAANFWEELNDDECEFLDACSNLDIYAINDFLDETPALIETQDKTEHHYGTYVVEWGSHNCRRECIGRRELFEQRAVCVLDALVLRDKNPFDKLAEAICKAVDYGYPLILDWLLEKLTTLDRAKTARQISVLNEIYPSDSSHVLPDDILDKIKALLGTEASLRG